MAELASTSRYTATWSGLRLLVPIGLLLALALIPAVSGAVGEPFYIRIAFRVIVFATAASALNLLLGYGGLISLLHAGLFGLGAYGVGILAFHAFNGDEFLGVFPGTAELIISIPIAVGFVALVAGMLGWISLRTGGTYFIMITLGFNQMLFFMFVALETYGGEDGLQILIPLTFAGADASSQVAVYYVSLALLAFTVFIVHRFVNSQFGLVLRAAAQNPTRVVALGIPILRYRLAAFVISGAIVGFAGTLWVVEQQFVSPADMSWVRSGDLIVMCVLGGLATAYGPLVGAAIFIVIEHVLSDMTIYWQLPFGVIVVLVAMYSRTDGPWRFWSKPTANRRD